MASISTLSPCMGRSGWPEDSTLGQGSHLELGHSDVERTQTMKKKKEKKVRAPFAQQTCLSLTPP